jgi:hypothetical protein
MESKKTLGAIATELQKNSLDNTHSAHDQMQEQLSEYDVNLYETLLNHKTKIFPHAREFFIVVLTQKIKIFNNALRNYFFGRLTCPTPEWDQTVYKYNRKDDCLEFMWTIPDKNTCEYMYYNALTIPDEEKELLKYVIDYKEGNLLKVCKQLNKETEHTGQLLLH